MLVSHVLLFAIGAVATPHLLARQSIVPLSTAAITSFKTYSYFASAAYCTPSTILSWSCGANCIANPEFETVASGGDGNDIQFWYVGYNPTSQEVIVSHQGSDIASLESDLTDADFFLESLDTVLFPGISSSIQVHNGFALEQKKTAESVLGAVQQAMSTYLATQVTMVGHSLGGAIALLDSVFLPLHLPTSTTFKTICYGLPRVGNQQFADYVDTHTHLTHVNNQKDPIPILPGRFLGFHHPAGEVHIQDSGDWDSCPGQDNPSNLCSVGDVPNVFDGDLSNHDGPYDGVEMGC